MSLLDRFPVLVWAGAPLLGWIAGEVIATDPAVSDFIHGRFDGSVHHSIDLGTAAAGSALVVLAGRMPGPIQGSRKSPEAARIHYYSTDCVQQGWRAVLFVPVGLWLVRNGSFVNCPIRIQTTMCERPPFYSRACIRLVRSYTDCGEKACPLPMTSNCARFSLQFHSWFDCANFAGRTRDCHRGLVGGIPVPWNR